MNNQPSLVRRLIGRRGAFGLLALVLLAAACARAPEGAQPDAQTEAAVRAVIEAQQAAWNRGDIEGYMAGYERADTTTFISGDTLTRGWQTVHDRYQQHYDTREKMGTLSFADIEVKPLSPFYAVVTGRWQLTRANDTPHGRFTLIFRRTSAGWRIVQDTTTSAG